jgi:CheY-like chemotaxis protein
MFGKKRMMIPLALPVVAANTPDHYDIRIVDEELECLPVDFHPDIVLADVEMPRMNGYLLCEKIKQDPSTSKIPVLLLAGAFEPFDEESAKRVRADGFVIKPFDAQELINKIQDAIESVVALEEGTFSTPQVKAAEEAEVEEDLWAMESITEPGELEKMLTEEETELEKEDIYKAAEEIGVSIGGKPGRTERVISEHTQ